MDRMEGRSVTLSSYISRKSRITDAARGKVVLHATEVRLSRISMRANGNFPLSFPITRKQHIIQPFFSFHLPTWVACHVVKTLKLFADSDKF